MRKTLNQTLNQKKELIILLIINALNNKIEVQGESMLPALTDKDVNGRDAMYYHYYENGEHAVSPHFGIQTKQYKLIRFYEMVDSWELYDLEKDPYEMKNLFGKMKYKKITADLTTQLKELIDQYEDKDAQQVLLNGE